jgi:predicted small secreted protein
MALKKKTKDNGKKHRKNTCSRIKNACSLGLIKKSRASMHHAANFYTTVYRKSVTTIKSTQNIQYHTVLEATMVQPMRIKSALESMAVQAALSTGASTAKGAKTIATGKTALSVATKLTTQSWLYSHPRLSSQLCA